MNVFSYHNLGGQIIRVLRVGVEIFHKRLCPRTNRSQAKETPSFDCCLKELIQKVGIIKESKNNEKELYEKGKSQSDSHQDF